MKGNVYIMKLENLLKEFIDKNNREPTKILLSYRYFKHLMREIYEGIPTEKSRYLLGLPIVVKSRKEIPDNKDVVIQ